MRLVSSSELSNRPHVDVQEKILKPKSGEYLYNDSGLWSPASRTVYIGELAFGLTVVEMTEEVVMRYSNGKYIRESEYRSPKASRGYSDHTWTTKKNIPCERLRVVIHSPQRGVSWSLSFQETAERTLTQDISKIVKAMEGSVATLRQQVGEAAEKAEVQRRELSNRPHVRRTLEYPETQKRGIAL